MKRRSEKREVEMRMESRMGGIKDMMRTKGGRKGRQGNENIINQDLERGDEGQTDRGRSEQREVAGNENRLCTGGEQ